VSFANYDLLDKLPTRLTSGDKASTQSLLQLPELSTLRPRCVRADLLQVRDDDY